MLHIAVHYDFDQWRTRARALLATHTPPETVTWTDDEALLFPPPEGEGQGGGREHGIEFDIAPASSSAHVPASFLESAKFVAAHRDPDRWNLLYRLLFRLVHENPRLLELITDDDVYRFYQMEKAVRRDEHKMHAFVRFRRIAADAGREHYVAWHRPDHRIVRLASPFFARRFACMRWSILTPDESAHWDGQSLTFSAGLPRSAAPQADELEDLWRTYYANIFNPARINLAAMRKELPVRHWKTLPEADAIPDLIKEAPKRVKEMISNRPARAPGAEAWVPNTHDLRKLAEAARACRGCELYKKGTQTVFGEGRRGALCVFVGEQPGDQEDLAGRPFVGPAGAVLDQALEEAGIDRKTVYVTNAVKHFNWKPRGKRRIHSKPLARHINACRPWLEMELEAIKPRVLVCLGATAAQALLGPAFRVTQHRGEVFKTEWAEWTMATIHPSAILRVPDEAVRQQTRADFVADLKRIARRLRSFGEANAKTR
jgi:probable DNA metabolism protein